MKKVNLLSVSLGSPTLTAITDNLSSNSLFSWNMETAANITAALRKIRREHFDLCLVDASLTEAECQHFLTTIAAEQGETALVIVHSSKDRRPDHEFDGPIDGRISLPNPSVESRLLAALLCRKARQIKAKGVLIDELNSTLNVLVHRIGKDAFEIEDRIQRNLKLLVFPYIEQLKNTRLLRGQTWCLDVLESNIRKIFSPFLKNLTVKSPRLSYAETRVADLIKEGKSSKEIASMLGVSEKTILTHRFHIRTKLGIKNKDVSLISYLTSLQ